MVRKIIFIILILITPALAADWPHWGGGLGRNMVNTNETNLPSTWDVKTGKNIKWSSPWDRWPMAIP